MPPGTWLDFYTGERHAGGQFITAAAPLDRIPVFARGGYVIPMYENAPLSTMDHEPELLELHVIVPGEDGETFSEMQEDDGLTNACKNGALLRTKFTVARHGARVTVTAESTGTGFPECRRSRLRFVLRGFSGDAVHLNGRQVLVQGARVECENKGERVELTFTV